MPMKSSVFPCATILLLTASQSFAANPQFQSFFDQACANASGQMSARCTGPTGSNLSGDSESSLTPSQMLSAGDTTLLAGDDGLQTKMKSKLTEVGPLSIALRLNKSELDADDRDSNNAERGYSSDTESLALVFDYRHSETLVSGIILSMDRSDLEFKSLQPSGSPFNTRARAGRYESDGLGLSGFVSFTNPDGLFVDGSLSYTAVDNDFARTSVYQPSNRALGQQNVDTSAEPDGTVQALSLRVGRQFQSGRLTITPSLGLTHSNSETERYSEQDDSNSGLAMRYQSFDQDSTRAQLGTALQLPFNTDFGVISTQLQLEYNREFGRDEEDLKASFVNDQSNTVFVIEGDDPDQSYFRAGFSVVAMFAQGWSAYIDYSQWLGNNEFDQYLSSLGIRKEL